MCVNLIKMMIIMTSYTLNSHNCVAICQQHENKAKFIMWHMRKQSENIYQKKILIHLTCSMYLILYIMFYMITITIIIIGNDYFSIQHDIHSYTNLNGYLYSSYKSLCHHLRKFNYVKLVKVLKHDQFSDLLTFTLPLSLFLNFMVFKIFLKSFCLYVVLFQTSL